MVQTDLGIKGIILYRPWSTYNYNYVRHMAIQKTQLKLRRSRGQVVNEWRLLECTDL